MTTDNRLVNFQDEVAQFRVEFERLHLADVSGWMETMQMLHPSRYQQPKRGALSPWLGGEMFRQGLVSGIEVEVVSPKTIEEFEACEMFYSPDGSPWANSVGQSLVLKQGWRDTHIYNFKGQHASKAVECLNRLDAFSYEYANLIYPKILPDRKVRIKNCGAWASTLNLIAENANWSSIPKPEWYVSVQGQAWSVRMWSERDHFNMLGFDFAEDLESLGEIPETYFCRRETFWRDSELALEWLGRQIERGDNSNVSPIVPVAASPKHAVDLNDLVVVRTAGDLWKTYADGKKPCFQSSGLSIRRGSNVPSVSCTDEVSDRNRIALELAQAIVVSEGGEKAGAMEKLIARIQLRKGMDKASVINMPLDEFTRAVMEFSVPRISEREPLPKTTSNQTPDLTIAPTQTREEKIQNLPRKKQIAIRAVEHARHAAAQSGLDLTNLGKVYDWLIENNPEYVSSWKRRSFQDVAGLAYDAIGEPINSRRAGRNCSSAVDADGNRH